MTKGRKAIVIVALILAVIMVTGRFLRQDERYLHVGHLSGIPFEEQRS
jgi:hypothetical protein